jgi:hypothetical protein
MTFIPGFKKPGFSVMVIKKPFKKAFFMVKYKYSITIRANMFYLLCWLLLLTTYAQSSFREELDKKPLSLLYNYKKKSANKTYSEAYQKTDSIFEDPNLKEEFTYEDTDFDIYCAQAYTACKTTIKQAIKENDPVSVRAAVDFFLNNIPSIFLPRYTTLAKPNVFYDEVFNILEECKQAEKNHLPIELATMFKILPGRKEIKDMLVQRGNPFKDDFINSDNKELINNRTIALIAATNKISPEALEALLKIGFCQNIYIIDQTKPFDIQTSAMNVWLDNPDTHARKKIAEVLIKHKDTNLSMIDNQRLKEILSQQELSALLECRRNSLQPTHWSKKKLKSANFYIHKTRGLGDQLEATSSIEPKKITRYNSNNFAKASTQQKKIPPRHPRMYTI